MSNVFELKPTKISLHEFGMTHLPKEAQLDGYEAGHFAVPPRNDDYVFQRAKLRDLLAFWESGLVALKLRGDPGTGKSSLPEQFHNRLNWPLLKVSCSPSTEACQLLGQLVPISVGALEWRDGPVLQAARFGWSVLLDEYNLLDPGQASGLNLLLDGYSICIPETGEIVKPARGFRVFATENPVDSELAVAGRNVQDVANDDRWMEIEVDYLPEADEVEMISRKLVTSYNTKPEVAQMLASQVVKVAKKTREAYRDKDPSIDKPMSSRAAMRWAMLVRRFQNVAPQEGGPILYALRRGVSMRKDMREAVEGFVRVAIGGNAT